MADKIRIRQFYGQTTVPAYRVQWRGETYHLTHAYALNWAIAQTIALVRKDMLDRVQAAD